MELPDDVRAPDHAPGLVAVTAVLSGDQDAVGGVERLAQRYGDEVLRRET